MTVAWEIKSPIKRKTVGFPEGYRNTLVTIWHVDPETDGSDDSCGWFMRARHGDRATLERIIKDFEFDWDRVFVYDPSEDCDDGKEKRIYPSGMFNPSGVPRFSVMGIVLNLFWIAANQHFKCDGRSNWKKTHSFMKRNLFDIMFFAENPTDSLFDGITLKYGNDIKREERIRDMAGCIYSWILRKERPWYKHPRWHIHHWKIQIHFILSLKRWLFSRCCKCGRRFTWGYAPVSDQWNGTGPLWFRSEEGVYHGDCCNPASDFQKATPCHTSQPVVVLGTNEELP